MSERGRFDSDQLRTVARQGTGSKVQMFGGGSTTNGDVSVYNAPGDVVDSGVLLSALATKLGMQQLAYMAADDTGAANAYVISLTPAPTIQKYSIAVVTIAHTNTTASTLAVTGAVSGGSATAIKKESSSGLVDLASGDWRVGQIAIVVHDGTVWQWVSGSGSGSSILLQTNTVNNGSQSKLDLVAGAGVTIADGGTGNVTISSSIGPSGSYNVVTEITGQPIGGSLTLGLFVFTEAVTFGSNWFGSQGKVRTNPTVAQTWTLNKNGSSVGSVLVSTGGVVTFTSSGSVSFSAGDLLSLVGSASADATLANVSFTLQGTRASVTSTPIAVLPFQWLGQVPASQLLGAGYVFTNAITFLGNWSGAFGRVGTNPAATWTASVKKNGSSIGTVVISTSGVFTFASTAGAAFSFVAGDVITVVSPASVDTTLQNVAFSFSGSAGGFVQLGQDIGNTTTSPKVVGLQGVGIAVTSPTNGQALEYNSSSGLWEPTTIPTATTSVLGLVKPDGSTITISAGVISAVGGGGGGGGNVLLQSLVASASTELDFTTSFSSTYDKYLIEVLGITVSVSGACILLQFSTNGGSSYDTTSIYDWTNVVTRIGASGAPGQNFQGSVDGISLFSDSSRNGLPTSSNFGMSCDFKICDPLNASAYKTLYGAGVAVYVTGAPRYTYTFSGVYNSNTAANAFRLKPSSGTFTGKVRCFGIPH